MHRKAIIAPLAALGSLSPMVALAVGNVTKICEIIGNAANVVSVFGTIILFVALAVLLYSAFLFMTGGGNEETLKKAKTFLIFSLIGLAVALLATFADDILIQLLGGTFVEGCPNLRPFSR